MEARNKAVIFLSVILAAALLLIAFEWLADQAVPELKEQAVPELKEQAVPELKEQVIHYVDEHMAH